jgi:hypothetical protein
MRDVLGLLSERGVSLVETKLDAEKLVALLRLLDQGRVTAASAREIFVEMAQSGERPEAIMAARGLEAVSDSGELERLAQTVIDANAPQVAKYRGGDTKLLNFFVGQVMKASAGKADPAKLREILTRLLAGIGALWLAFSAPASLVLCESDDGHVAVERTHVGDVCFAEAVRHSASTGASETDPAHCADTVVDVRLMRSADGHEELAPIALAHALPGVDAPAAVRPAHVHSTPQGPALHLSRTIVLRL